MPEGNADISNAQIFTHYIKNKILTVASTAGITARINVKFNPPLVGRFDTETEMGKVAAEDRPVTIAEYILRTGTDEEKAAMVRQVNAVFKSVFGDRLYTADDGQTIKDGRAVDSCNFYIKGRPSDLLKVIERYDPNGLVRLIAARAAIMTQRSHAH